jgi:hypothetical protein
MAVKIYYFIKFFNGKVTKTYKFDSAVSRQEAIDLCEKHQVEYETWEKTEDIIP